MLLQSKTPALDDRISEPRGVRNAGGISLGGCQPNRVQATACQSKSISDFKSEDPSVVLGMEEPAAEEEEGRKSWRQGDQGGGARYVA